MQTNCAFFSLFAPDDLRLRLRSPYLNTATVVSNYFCRQQHFAYLLDQTQFEFIRRLRSGMLPCNCRLQQLNLSDLKSILREQTKHELLLTKLLTVRKLNQSCSIHYALIRLELQSKWGEHWPVNIQNKLLQYFVRGFPCYRDGASDITHFKLTWFLSSTDHICWLIWNKNLRKFSKCGAHNSMLIRKYKLQTHWNRANENTHKN